MHTLEGESEVAEPGRGADDSPEPFAVASDETIGWKVFKNTSAQIAGRVLIALARLASVAIIVRAFGKTTFGEYSLIFGVVVIAEWLLDFGTSETFVREICKEPSRGRKLMDQLTTLKLVQVPIAIAVLAIAFTALQLPPHIIAAGMLGALSLVFHGGVLIYRVLFRATLTMERDVAAEFLSALFMVPLVATAGWLGLGLPVLVGCHVASRAAFLLLAYRMGRKRYRPRIAFLSSAQVRWLTFAAVPIGFSGFLAVVYETADILILSRLAGIESVAFYSGALRFVTPVILVQASVGWTLYSMSSSYWPHDHARFTNAAQRAMETVMIISGLAAAVLFAGSDLLMAILGPELQPAALTLRILAVLCFVKAVATTVGPLLYVVNAQKEALRFLAAALAVRLVIVAAVAPRFGHVGVAIAAAGVETAVTVTTLILVRRFTGARLRWSMPAKIIGALVVASVTTRLIMGSGFAAIVVAPALFVALLFAAGAIRPSELLAIVRERRTV